MSTQETYGKRATRGFAWNHFYKFSEFGLLNVYTMIIARHFGPVGSTPYVVYAAAGTTLSLFGAFAVDGVLLRYLPRISESGITDEMSLPGVTDLRSFVRKLFAFRLFIVTAIIALLVACVLLFAGSFDHSDTFDSIRSLAPILSVFLLAQAITAFSSFSLIGLLRTKAVFIASVVARVGMLVAALVMIFVVGDISIRTAILIHVSGALLNGILLLVNIRHVLAHPANDTRVSIANSLRAFVSEIYAFVRKPSTIKALLISPVMLYGMTAWGSDLVGIALGRQSDILMLRAIWGDKTPEVGYYNVASLIVLLTEYIFLLGFGGALLSVFSKLAHDDERDSSALARTDYARLRRGGSEVVGFQHITLVPLCAFVFMFALTSVQAIYGGQYDPSAPLVKHAIIALAVNIVFFNGGLHITTLMAIGRQRTIFKNRLFWGIVCLVLNYFMIRSYGALGAMLGTNWVNTCACGTEWYIARKHVGSVSNLASSAKVCLISVAAAIGVWQLMQMLDLRQGAVAEVLIAGPIFFAVVIGLFFLFRLPETAVFMSRLRKAFA